jgi:polar amino acid transport system permease protein
MYRWDFAPVLRDFDLLLRGLVGTLQLAITSLLAAAVLGLLLGAMRATRRPLLDWPATAAIELFRNTPVLVQLMWFYFAFPILIGAKMTAFAAATLALTCNTSAFMAEIFRGGIQSIDRGQWDGGRAIGMSYVTLMRRVILPQAVKRMLPAFTNRAVELTKSTSLASTIAFAELLYEGKLLTSISYRPLETYSIIAGIYFVLLGIGTLGVRLLERRLARTA